MILYFADRKMNILGLASTHLHGGCDIQDDLKTSEIETGVSTFSFTVSFTDDTRAMMEECLEAGNYVLRSNEDEAEFYTIIDETIDTKEQTIEVYCEDAGMDLLNSDAQPFEAPEAHHIEWYFDKYLSGTGFTIKENQYGTGNTRKLKWDGVSTVAERLASIATQFDNCEISFSFEIDNLSVKNKYVNIYRKDGRGKSINDQLRLNRDVDRIITTKSVANLATALYCTGGTPEGTENPITLSGYQYDDGDFYVDGKYLKSRNAVKKWGRFPGFSNHVVKTYSYDTTSQATLCSHAVTELKKICDTEVNYEVDLEKLPDDIQIGDRINLVDDAGELYVQTRLLKTEVSICDGTSTATLGEFLIKSSGISAKVEQLAEQFAEQARVNQVNVQIAQSTADDAKSTAESILIYDHSYDMDDTLATFTAYLYQGGTDVKAQYDPSLFTWYLKTESGSTYLGSGYTMTVDTTDCGYGAEVLGKFTTTDDSELLTQEGDSILSSDDQTLTVRATGDSVRINELIVVTTLYPTEKIVVVGAEDEHLVTMQSLQQYLDANLTKQIKFNTTAGWDAQAQLVSAANTLYIYTDHDHDSGNNAIAGIKAGDGNAYLIDLPFTDAAIMEHIADSSVHVTTAEKAAWNNKVRCYYSGEQLVFTTA